MGGTDSEPADEYERTERAESYGAPPSPPSPTPDTEAGVDGESDGAGESESALLLALALILTLVALALALMYESRCEWCVDTDASDILDARRAARAAEMNSSVSCSLIGDGPGRGGSGAAGGAYADGAEEGDDDDDGAVRGA